jgi:activator of HSP90 ATPase
MSIAHDIVIPAAPDAVYRALTDSAEFTTLSGGRAAQIDPTEGGSFALFGGYVVGRQLELVPGQRIVQAWRATPWAAGHYSIVSFHLSAEGDGTRVRLEHDAYPVEEHEHLHGGWVANYMRPLAARFAG